MFIGDFNAKLDKNLDTTVVRIRYQKRKKEMLLNLLDTEAVQQATALMWKWAGFHERLQDQGWNNDVGT